jgi:hypothetical protein
MRVRACGPSIDMVRDAFKPAERGFDLSSHLSQFPSSSLIFVQVVFLGVFQCLLLHAAFAAFLVHVFCFRFRMAQV